MTTTDAPNPPVDEPVATSCPRCGAPMRADQDWCLACGAAVTTEVTGARGWRTPIVIVGAVLAVAAVALIIAFVQLSDNADTTAQAPAPTAAATPAPAAAQPAPQPTAAAPATTPAPAPSGTPAPSTTPAPATGAIAEWPAGKTAYTVILWSATTRKEAETKATQLQGAGAQGVGILHSDDYSSLRAGYYVVFSGQYGTDKEAQTAAQAAQGTAPGAYAKQVKPK